MKFGIFESTQSDWHASSKQSFKHNYVYITCLRSWNKKSQVFQRIPIQKFFYRLVWLNWLTTLNPFVAKLGTLNRSINLKIHLQDNKIKTLQICSFWMNFGSSIWNVSPKGENNCTNFSCSSTNLCHSTLTFWCHIFT